MHVRGLKSYKSLCEQASNKADVVLTNSYKKGSTRISVSDEKKTLQRNHSRVLAGNGAILYMIISTGFIGLVVMAEAWPVYMLFKARLYQVPLSSYEWMLIFGSLSLVLMLNGAAFLLPLHRGIKHLEKREKSGYLFHNIKPVDL